MEESLQLTSLATPRKKTSPPPATAAAKATKPVPARAAAKATKPVPAPPVLYKKFKRIIIMGRDGRHAGASRAGRDGEDAKRIVFECRCLRKRGAAVHAWAQFIASPWNVNVRPNATFDVCGAGSRTPVIVGTC